MTIFNQRTLIRDYDDDETILDVTEEMLDKLDAMLTVHGIEHAFSLPMMDDFDDHPDAQLALYFLEDDSMKAFLVYALWLKTERNMPDERIKKGMAKYIED